MIPEHTARSKPQVLLGVAPKHETDSSHSNPYSGLSLALPGNGHVWVPGLKPPPVSAITAAQLAALPPAPTPRTDMPINIMELEEQKSESKKQRSSGRSCARYAPPAVPRRGLSWREVQERGRGERFLQNPPCRVRGRDAPSGGPAWDGGSHQGPTGNSPQSHLPLTSCLTSQAGALFPGV